MNTSALTLILTPADALGQHASALVTRVIAYAPAPSIAHQVAVDPNSKLPGTVQLTSLVGGLMTWVLLACVAAVLIGAASWGFGSRSGHFQAQQQGRTMVLGGVAGAMITGAATALVNFGFGIGGAVH